MPRRRKTEVGTAPDRAQEEEIQVKTERTPSSPEGKETSPPPPSQDVELSQSLFGRNLRPRKSTCYVERDSPDFEVKGQKVPRKKRRLNTAETASDDAEEPGVKKANSLGPAKSDLHSSLATKEVRVQLEKLEVADIISAKKIPTSGNVKGSETSDKLLLSTSSSASPKEDESKNSNTESAADNPVKKPRRRRRRKPNSSCKIETEHDGGATKFNTKIEPESSAKETEKDETGPFAPDAPGSTTVKPLPKKRIRNKKPKANAEKDSEDKPGLDVRVTKKEVAAAGESDNKTESGESKDEEGGVTGETKENADPSLQKKPVKRKRKSKKNESTVMKEHDTSQIKVDGGALVKVEPKEGSQDVKEKSDDASKTEDATVKKRVRRRPRKVPLIPNTNELVLLKEGGATPPVATTITKIEIDANNETAKVTSEDIQSNIEKEASSAIPSIPKSCTGQLHPALPVTRKSGFFRGRRAKSLSSRTGKKEDIHIEESIDPEEIKGFEDVERYVTPEGVKLSKFWDSEDEVSDDDSNDNFRRIMCGFGANCRVHEVIRPASEIVRRLKELQNTFGASRTLPLFPKREGCGSMDAESTLYQEECENGSVQNIIWHNDPSFYSYLNNFP